MNLHQVLTGACNAGDHCFAVGSVEGVPFTAYAAGCDIVILASNFQRVQIIPGVCHGNIQVVCLDCSTDRGKIAAAYDNIVCVYEPTPLINKNSSHKLDYCWVQTGTFNAECHIHNLSWNLEGTRLLTGGECIQLWNHGSEHEEEQENEEKVDGNGGIHFQVGDEECPKEKHVTWQCIWKCKTANPVFHLKFSPDGTLFASAGKEDRLVKIWYEYKPVSLSNKSFDMAASMSSLSASSLDDVSYTFIYIAHPRAVTGLSWRKTSKYMPRGSVANMLVSSCRDNICRLWVQTVLPDDGLINLQQFDPMGSANPKYRMNRHKHKFMVRLKHMKTCFHFRRRHAAQQPHSNGLLTAPIPSLPSTLSSHDFHSFGINGTGITPGFHFHLATSINAETDIPLVPSIRRRDNHKEPNFVLHWLNNKEMHFTLCAEHILHDLCEKAILSEQHSGSNEAENGHDDLEEHMDTEEGEEAKETNATKKKSKKGKLKGFGHKLAAGKKSGEDGGGESERPAHSPVSVNSLPSTLSSSSISTDNSMGTTTPLGDALDRKIEVLLRDWQQNPDLLFSVHPVDGSFLVWVVDWLDECAPGSYRQAQVSFSSRIPNALPLGDAMTMSTNLTLYNCKTYLDLKTMLDDAADEKANAEHAADGSAAHTPGSTGHSARRHPGHQGPAATLQQQQENPFAPTISMLSKHKNGTLNLWTLTFTENTKFTQVLSVGHQARVCGHRFRVNDITCHPVLPLLLTTSHHNLPKLKSPLGVDGVIPEDGPYDHCNGTGGGGAGPYSCSAEDLLHSGFCSELILWRIDPVGPLCMSGGVTELARINSPEINAFSNVAWIPTLLPSTTLGSISNSPSACFVASDGQSLRVYQAVIDARTLLAELFSAERKNNLHGSFNSLSSSSSMDMGFKQSTLQDKFHIISQQSTARPGCIIQLDPIVDATHDWHNTQLLHVFQEQLITGERVGEEDSHSFLEPTLSAIVDLHNAAIFEEPFYLVVLEKNGVHSILHMWRIVIASQPSGQDDEEGMVYAPDSNIIIEGDDSSASSRSEQMDGEGQGQHALVSPVAISTTKVCTQVLSLPEDVEIIHAAPAAGHLSSSSIYPACFAPYLICTACSDGSVRFWSCNVIKPPASGGDANTTTTNNNNIPSDDRKYEWKEWEMMINDEQSSQIDVPGTLLNASVAYSGRIACAYKHGQSFTRPQSDNPHNRYVNLCVAIYECESTGGSEWILEDTIQLRNIQLPEIKFPVDMRYLNDPSILERKKQSLTNLVRTLSNDEVPNLFLNGGEVDHVCANLHGLIAVPSFSTLQTLRKTICEKGNQFPLSQKHLVQLDWVSTEDGSHVLTIGVGSTVLLFTAVGSDIAQANLKAMKDSRGSSRPILKKASSMVVPMYNAEEVRWMKVQSVNLVTADGLPPLPMQISWVRDGILVVGMDNEMHVYSQWKDTDADTAVSHDKTRGFDDSIDNRTLTDKDLLNLAQEASHLRLLPVKSIPYASSSNLISGTDGKKKTGPTSKGVFNDSVVQAEALPDYGLFEASRVACPVLPQYHPKQLMELLNFGKIRRVKAILVHLVRCLAGSSVADPPASESRGRSQGGGSVSGGGLQRHWSRSRTMSVSAPPRSSPMDPQGHSTVVSEDLQLDYVEINSIPPLPLFTFLAADKEIVLPSSSEGDRTKGYGGLFDSITVESDETLDDILADEGSGQERKRSLSGERQYLSCFGSRQARILTQLLTHTHLPGLSSLDQMHLLALADTVATFNNEFSDKFCISSVKEAPSSHTEQSVGASADSLDDCGLRYLLAMRHQSYLLRCIPIYERARLHKQGISAANLVWAFHSESEEELLSMIPGMQRGNPKWAEMKELGVGWWVRSNATLKRVIEKVAKSAFQAHNNPMDSALLYLAMKKKNILWGLFRSVHDARMTQFFNHDFTQDRWRKAALKNAYALLGKQQFEHAAAFFLLSGSLPDAVKVCLTKLDDLQLAMVIMRLYDGDLNSCPPSLQYLLQEGILGCDADGSHYEPCNAHPDPFLRSMAYWLLKDYPSALSTLLQVQIGSNHPKAAEEDMRSHLNSSSANPNVFNFYLYLRTHPLFLRQQLAESVQDARLPKSVMLSGFSHAVEGRGQAHDRQIVLDDAITPLERRLYFTTAHAHFKAGCPALALEVLSKLPKKVMSPSVSPAVSGSLKSPGSIPSSHFGDRRIDTGTLDHGDWMPTRTADLDWSQPVTLTNRMNDSLDLTFPDDDPIENGDGLTSSPKATAGCAKDDALSDILEDSVDLNPRLDIMAQQLKFIACLKIVMEELGTLATGFEVDGGHLRYQLYIWLEQEVEALRVLCNYGSQKRGADHKTLEESEKQAGLLATPGHRGADKPTLHEILLADKMDFEAKLHRAERRRRWLKGNQTLLRTLLSYCCLHGANGGGLASVRMELILLLQELHQEKTQRQLLSPLPFPTTLPLLSASVACHKTVVTDPIRHLQSMTHDILHTVINCHTPPTPGDSKYCEMFILRDLSIALASCIYQSLCDSDTFSINQSGYISAGMEALASVVYRSSVVYHDSHLMAGQPKRRRFSSSEDPLHPTTAPNKWPGVTSLRALLAREKDEDTPRLTTLLCESFVAVYMSLLVHAMATCEAHTLYRLVSQKFTEKNWGTLFGGGARRQLKVSVNNAAKNSAVVPTADKVPASEAGLLNNLSKQRLKLHMKLLFMQGAPPVPTKEPCPTYREQFIPPEMSMVSCFMTKPLPPSNYDAAYDSSDSVHSEEENDEEEEEDDGTGDLGTRDIRAEQEQCIEHSDSNSYSWCILRYSTVRVVQHYLQSFLNVAGLELQELPVASPLIHSVLRILDHWLNLLKEQLDKFGGPPLDYIPGCVVEKISGGPSIQKYRSILEPHNTPFKSRHRSSLPVKRLWIYLVHQECVQEIFIRYIFARKRVLPSIREDSTPADNVDSDHVLPDPIRIIHKDQDSISAFCISKTNSGIISLASSKEVLELDISVLLEPPSWLEDDCEYDILNLRGTEALPAAEYLVVQTAADKPMLAQLHSSTAGSTASSAFSSPTGPGPSQFMGQTGRATTVLMKHKMEHVRRMSSHPLMPIYMTGSQDGTVRLWEWGHTQHLAEPRPAGTYAKVTRVRFNPQGNKFGISDGDGNLSLWQVGLGSAPIKPFFNLQCHTKQTSDFVFVASSSLIATAGHSSESRNVCLWDTLLPQKRCLVQAFSCHEQGSSSILYAPQHQLLISAGKKGFVCIFDVRQRQLRHRFQAHESAIKCLALDPNEEYFVTGSADGDIKIWGLNLTNAFFSFTGEHTRNTFFRSVSTGVTQLHVDTNNRLFSCGADGSMKLRQLPERELIISNLY